MPGGVAVAGYRIVQEALTNVLKHAGGAPTRVLLRWADGVLELEILDEGPIQHTSQEAQVGRGIAGMRERAAICGGTLDAQPSADAAILSAPCCRWSRPTREPPTADRRRRRARARGAADDLRRPRRSGGRRRGDDGLEAVEHAARLHPDVVLLDIRMPNLDGLEAARRILASSSNRARVIMLTTFDLDEYVYDALKAGASGFLRKDTPTERLLAFVRSASEDDALLDPTITRRLVERYALRTAHRRLAIGLSALTPREFEVLSRIARGHSNAEIART